MNPLRKGLQWLALGTRRGWPVFLMVMGLVGQTGCGMFDLRNPVEPPNPGPGIPSLPWTSPENVLFNFAEAVKANRDGLVQYGDALAEPFELRLDAIDVLEMGAGGREFLCKAADTDAQRTRAGELEALMTGTDSLSFVFGNIEPERTDTTAFYLDIPYELQLIRPEGDSLIVQGKAELFMLENRQTLEWEITRWIDKREDPATSFGRWHGERAVVDCP